MYNYSIQVGLTRKEWMGVSPTPIIEGKRQSKYKVSYSFQTTLIYMQPSKEFSTFFKKKMFINYNFLFKNLKILKKYNPAVNIYFFLIGLLNNPHYTHTHIYYNININNIIYL